MKMENRLFVRSLPLNASASANMSVGGRDGVRRDEWTNMRGDEAMGGSSLGSCSEGHRAAREAGCYGLFSTGEGGDADKVCVALSARPPCDL